MDAYLVGKTHMQADAEGLRRLGIAPDSICAAIGAASTSSSASTVSIGGGGGCYYDERRSPPDEYLKSRGYSGDNPWQDYANSALQRMGTSRYLEKTSRMDDTLIVLTSDHGDYLGDH